MGWGGVVDTDALLSSSPSLIWLQLGFGLAGAVTINGPQKIEISKKLDPLHVKQIHQKKFHLKKRVFLY